MSSKRFVIWFLSVLLFSIVGVSVFVWYVDPYQFYRKNDFYPISKNYRYQNPGLAKNYEYETVIIGTSIAHVLQPIYVDSLFQTSTMKLTIKGSANREQHLMAQVALRTGKVKRVIWGVDYFTATRPYNKALNDESFPYYLYDENFFNDWTFLFNKDNLNYTIKCFLQKEKALRDFNEVEKQYKAVTGLKHILKRGDVDSYDFPGEIEKIEINLKENIDYNLFNLIQQYPNVQFDLYLPPYTVLFLQDEEVNDRNTVFRDYLFNKLSTLNNVILHDFQADSSLTWDFSSFVDRYHSTVSMGEQILNGIHSGNYILDNKKFEENQKIIKRHISIFDVDDYLKDEVSP